MDGYPGSGSSDSPGQASSSAMLYLIAMPHAQRNELRQLQQAMIRQSGAWTTGKLVEFFSKKYGVVLNENTIYYSLSDVFKFLDGQDYLPRPDVATRQGSPWPDLDAALFDWRLQMLRRGRMTDKKLKIMAHKFFTNLPQYRDVKPPKFADKWLLQYKQRYEIIKPTQGSASGVVGRLHGQTDGQGFLEKLNAFPREDVYVMEETPLFWKLAPDDDTTWGIDADDKLDKARVTVVLACNSTGTRKLPPWFVGKARMPRCFESSGVHMKNFSMVWRYNKKAWMTGLLFVEYLRWFDSQMAGRKACLLVNEVSAHIADIGALLSSPDAVFENTTILVLPTITTDIPRVMGLGIFHAWKTYYRKRWLVYLCSEFHANRDPLRTVNILQAIRFGITAWEDDVTATTIQNSWIKSLILAPPLTPPFIYYDKEADDKVYDTIATMKGQADMLVLHRYIPYTMRMSIFIEPDDETFRKPDFEEAEDTLFESMVESYSTGGEERGYETDEEDMVVAPVQGNEALIHLSRLRLYEEQQENGNEVVLAQLKAYTNMVCARGAF